jgi:hypothetical protein
VTLAETVSALRTQLAFAQLQLFSRQRHSILPFKVTVCARIFLRLYVFLRRLEGGLDGVDRPSLQCALHHTVEQ